MLVKAGGSGKMTPQGILSFESGWDMSVDYGGSDSSSGSAGDDYGGGDDNNNQSEDNNDPPTNDQTTDDSLNIDAGQADNNYVPDYESPMTTEQEKIVTGNVDAENEYLPPDKDHYLATQAAINASIKDMGDNYAADWNDWSEEQQDTYQLEMNKLKGTEGKNYSFYKGNKGTTNLSFNEHWKDAVITTPALKYSPNLRLLVSAANSFKENLTTDYGTWKYGAAGTEAGKAVDQGGWMGRVFNSDGSVNTNITESEASQLYLEAQNDLPSLIGGTTPQPSMATQWYANLGQGTQGFNFHSAYANAKAAVSQRLGNSTSVGQLAVNQSPFYNWLKDNSLNKGIL
jgi:hypothetical protein